MKTRILIFIFGILMIVGLFPVAAFAGSAQFYVSPGSGSYSVGDTITALVMINSGGQAINAGEGTLNFSSDLLQFQSVSTSGSVFSFWTSGPTGGSSTVSFGGGLSNPGYNGSAGKVLSVTFKAIANGTAQASVSGGKILANDGLGTNVYGSSSGASYSIGPKAVKKTAPKAPVVTSSSHPDQNKWYNNKNIELSWTTPAGVTGFFTAFDQNAATDPATARPLNVTSESRGNTADGVWYFHVKGKTDSGTTPVTHFKIQIDTIAPDEFGVTISQDGGLTNPSPKATFEAKDATSGVEYYEGRVNAGDPFRIKSGDVLPKYRPGSYELVIKAVDYAGNSRESRATYKIEGIDAPVIMEWTKLASLLSPINFIGRSSANDTIHVFLNNKEVDKFLAKDKRVAYAQYTLNPDIQESDEIAWHYTYTAPLYPGKYSFQFSRTNAAGAESALSESYPVQVQANTIAIGAYTLPFNEVLIVVGLLLLILILLIIILLRKIHELTKRGLNGLGAKIRALFIKTEKEVEDVIDRDVPEKDLSRSEAIEIKQHLHKDVKEVVDDEVHHLDK